ncbi:MAG: tetratricopeptide repeat protein [Bacteroidota bacterium]|jgi:TolA-binding protein|nr:tetratricopeptide repeat protein [Bacteroidota bacterium]
MMKCLLFACAITALFGVACAPLVELEDETVTLRARADSLDGLLTECQAETVRLQESLSAVEERNLALDDRARALSAELAEARYRTPDEDVVDPGKPTPESDIRIEGATAASMDVETVRAMASYDGRVQPDIDFLGRYQSALGAYHARHYPDALRQFADLLAGARPNDMIDNCLYWMGESAMQLGRHDEAIHHFTRVIACTGADKVDDALYSRAMAHRAAGRHAEARADLDLLVRQFPHSELTGQARRALKQLH